MTVDFFTFCHKGDIHRLYHGDWLQEMVLSHNYYFRSVDVVYQRLGNVNVLDNGVNVYRSEDYPNILAEFGYPDEDKKADKYTHGENGPHYWKWHNINHLIGLKVSTADYIVFSDSDCFIRSSDPDENWIKKGIEMLKKYSEILIVSPGDGAKMAEAHTAEGYRLTQNVSQQLFLCERKRLANINFNIPWDWEFLAPGEPFQEFYYLLEGRIWRYMHQQNLWRCILPDYIARYWHFNRLTEEGFLEMDYGKY